MVSPYSVARIFITENGEFVESFWISQRVLWVLWFQTPIILCSETQSGDYFVFSHLHKRGFDGFSGIAGLCSSKCLTQSIAPMIPPDKQTAEHPLGSLPS